MEYIGAAPTHLAKLDRVQRAAEKLCGCTFQTLTDRREAAVFSMVCKLLDGECVGPLQKFAPEFEADSVVMVKTRLQHKVQSNKSEELKHKQNQHRNFSLNNYKWSWQGQAARIFNRIPADLKAKGTKGSWMKIKSVGKAIINGSAEMKKLAAPKRRGTNDTTNPQKAISTGSASLNNELNANLTNWIEYTIAWNTNKTESYRNTPFYFCLCLDLCLY